MARVEPLIEYATTADGVRIATQCLGSGPPVLMPATLPWSHVQQDLRIPAVGAWIRSIAEGARVVRYDARGTGLSDREAVDFSLDAQLRDLEAVVHHYALDSFAVWGAIGGSQVSIAYTARQPERVSRLMLWGAFARFDSLSVPGLDAFTTLMRDNWRFFTDAYAQAAFGWPDSDTAAQYAQLTRDCITQPAMLELMRQMSEIDVSGEARTIRTPTLVLVRRGATIAGVEQARALVGLIPTARLLILEGSSHAPFLERPEDATAALHEFVTADVEVRVPRPAPMPLTERERQVLQLLANGRTGKEIAAQLSISLPTAQRHIANIYGKIGARGRVEAAAYAFEHGMIGKRGA